MATDDEQSPAEPSPNGVAQDCTPCRATGRLISGLGGTPHEVTCPWCHGTGRRIPGLNAQEAPAEGTPADTAAGDEPPVT